MNNYRITEHPILPIEPSETLTFTWEGQELTAQSGEMIASALFAHGIRIFGSHPKDHAPLGIFCANGQCSQCLVLANNQPVKACMTPVEPGMDIRALHSLPTPPPVSTPPRTRDTETVSVPVLIIGGGPAGLSAAIQLGQRNIQTLLVDDKPRLGGKLVLQTHRFFGSVDAAQAGTRGIDIAQQLAQDARQHASVKVWLNSPALAIFSDQKVGILYNNKIYTLVKPQTLLIATGARERSLVFKGNTLPGVYGAGAFQTLVNRDLIKAAERIFIIGGGNVGLIAGYHALQAGIEVVGLAEVLPECGGYKVHKDKLARIGVPIYTSHTIISANGETQVNSVTIAAVDEQFQPIPGTEKSFACDTVLVAVGLDPVDEFTTKARAYGMRVFDAGDAQEVAEASAAMFSGKIAGVEIAQALESSTEEIPEIWRQTAEILKSHPGAVGSERLPQEETGVFPVFHCAQEIPCNPCSTVCPQQLIYIDPQDIRHTPKFLGPELDKACLGCERCVTICPGLAITLVDYGDAAHMPTVTIPYEFNATRIDVGEIVTVVDVEGHPLGEAEVTHVRDLKRNAHTLLLKLRAPASYAKQIAGIRVQEPDAVATTVDHVTRLADDDIICRCERVTAGEIRALIRKGYYDINEIKAVTRAGMGACGGKTCSNLILRLFREEGVPLEKVTQNVKRPLFMEVPLGTFAGCDEVDYDDV